MEPDNNTSGKPEEKAPGTEVVTPVAPQADAKNDSAAMKRVFVYDGREFPDPDPALTVEQVRQYYATFMPELSNATTSETTRQVREGSKTTDASGADVVTPPEQERVITFTKRVGTKGCTLGHCTVKGATYGGGRSVQKGDRCPICKGPMTYIDEAEFKKIMDAFRANVELGLKCNIVFDGKCAILLPVGTESGVTCGRATLVKES